MAHSLKNQGVLQPVIVRHNGEGGFDLVAGERRWRAAQIAGLMKIPALVRDVADEQLLEIALLENLQRADLNPIEEANAYQSLLNDLELTQQEISERIGKPRATIANALRLLNLPPEVQELVRSGHLSAGHGKLLAGVATSSEQIDLARRIARDELSVRQAELLVKSAGTRAGRAPASRKARRDPNVEAAEQKLQKELGTKVRIVQARKGGRLELHYFSNEELERIYQLVLRAARGS